ncbi:MAG: iron ABC transporter permease [Clostridiales bacterium]|jgi:iron complex transport system permease protein|nr:iron ABC transporter permease [Clostridiales bacterium]
MKNALHIERELEKYNAHQAKGRRLIATLFVLLIVCIIVSASVGSSSVNFEIVLKTLCSYFSGVAVEDVYRSIVMDVRLPRVFCAVFAGASLSMAGLIMQGVFQNPLVSPYTLGVSNGASFGASLAIIMSAKLSFLGFGIYLTPIFAFIFSMLTMLLVYTISKLTNHDTRTLILSGVAIGYLFSALVSALKYISDVQSLPELVFWSMGSLSGLKWNVVFLLLMVFAVCFVISICKGWNLNVMALGYEESTALGVDYRKMLVLSFVVTTILTATSVAFTGVIGFVGLIAPHVTRMLIGGDYRYCIPASALMGSLLLLISDTLARTMFSPVEIPVGIITSFIGVPFFLYLIVRRRKV